MSSSFSVIFCSLLSYSAASLAQECRLNGKYEESSSGIILDWNMIRYATKTACVLLKSTDNKAWTAIITGKFIQNYASKDIFEYEDEVKNGQKYYYRLKIIDANNKKVALSNIVEINTTAAKNAWTIYPNPVSDILHLEYKGSVIKGVINLTVQDVSGKIAIRFRAASINRILEIPVAQLRKGMYIVQISILNEVVMNEEIIKQ